MPRVNDEYLASKRSFILACLKNILNEKPLYTITMRDIIKEAGFSQGTIYRYYSSLDDIYIDFINMYTANDSLAYKIDKLLDLNQEEAATLENCFILMGDYIHEMLKSEVGKTFFELIVLYGSDIEKRNDLLPKLKFKQNLDYAQQRTIEYVLKSVNSGIFEPLVPVPSIIQFVSVFIDGLAQTVVMANRPDSETTINISEMFKMLAKTVTDFLNVNKR